MEEGGASGSIRFDLWRIFTKAGGGVLCTVSSNAS